MLFAGDGSGHPLEAGMFHHGVTMKDESQESQAEFLDAFARRTGRPRTEVELWWKLFCDHGFEWIVIQERPLDLGFVTLHLVPFRVNWKYLLWEDTLSTRRQRKRFDRGILADGRYLAISSEDKKWYCRHYVEVEHNPAWFRNLERVHKARVRRRKLKYYVKDVVAHIQRRAAVFVRLYNQWMDEGLYPSGVLAPGTGERSSDVVRGRSGTLPGTSIQPGDVPTNLAGPRLAAVPVSEPQAVPAADGSLPAVPDLQPQTQDVRDGGTDVSESPHAALGANGLPVRDAGQGDVPQ